MKKLYAEVSSAISLRQLFRHLFHSREEFGLDWIKAQRFSDTRETPSVDRKGPESFERAAVLGCRITLVSCESVAGVELIHLEHVRVAGGLRDDGRGCDTCGERVAADDSALRHLAVRDLSRVNKNEVGL